MARNFIPLVPSGTINADASVAQLEQDVLAMDSKVGELAEDIGATEQEINDLKSQINEVESGFPQKSASGAIVTIDDGADNVPVVSLTAQITPVQSGTGDPSPDNVRPISGWTGANVFDTGVNLWNPNRADAEHGYYNEIGDFNENNAWVCLSFPCSEGMSFAKSGSDWGGLVTFWNNESFVSSANVTTATIPSGVDTVRFACKASSTNAQLEVGSTASSFVPYIGSAIPITFPTEAGTVYGGSIKLNQDGTADLTVDRAIYNMGMMGWHAYTAWGSDHTFWEGLPNEADVTGATASGVPAKYITSALKGGTQNTALGGTEACFWIRGDNRIIYISVPNATTTEQVQAALANQILVYPITNPTTYHIENVELVKTLYGLNNIWADTGDIDLVYRADPATYTAEQIRIMLNAMIAPVEASTTASKAYSVNDFLILDNVLYKVIANIANGGTITPNTNVSATTVGEQLTAILNS